MGIPGMKTFLSENQAIAPINVSEVLEQYKRNNPNKKPLIVIDFPNFCNGILKRFSEFIYGGRHFQMQQYFELIMEKFLGCDLVFFTDCNIQDGKRAEWLNRRNQDFGRYQNLYRSIEESITSNALMGIVPDMTLRSVCFEIERLAPKFGQFYYSYKRECDVEIARYAMENNALAVISSDTDFVIFPGQWKLWAGEFSLDNSGSIITTEYNRNALTNLLSLSHDQLPLFATLLGNDFTKRFSRQLVRKFGYGLESKINVSNYVRNLNSAFFSDLDLVRITQDIFGYTNRELQQIFRQSLDFYDIDSPMHIWIDANSLYPFADQLSGTAIYPTYLMIMSKVQCISMGYYDMLQGGRGNRNLPRVLIEWMKRKKGVLHNDDATYTFYILAKTDYNRDFQEYRERPVYPPIIIPPLDRLYLGRGNDSDPELDSIRFQILGWIMSLPEEIISRIREYGNVWQRMKTITLYALVKVGLISVEQADSIFYTEKRAHDRNIRNVVRPTNLLRENIRAAHIYNIAFSHVRQNFAIAGLLSEHFLQNPDFDVTETVLLFDGVYFHWLIEQIDGMMPQKYQDFLVPIREFRIYAELQN